MASFSEIPEGCIAEILSLTTPADACRAAVIAWRFKSAADSDGVWERFLPSDHSEIVARSVSPVVHATKKQLYFGLCDSPILIDGGKMSFALTKHNGRKCFMLQARELSIAWKDTPYYWKWRSLPESRSLSLSLSLPTPTCGTSCHDLYISLKKIVHTSPDHPHPSSHRPFSVVINDQYLRMCRFSEVAELVSVFWLDIGGKIGTKLLSPKTTYGAYLVFKLGEQPYGLDYPAKAVVRFARDREYEAEVGLGELGEDGISTVYLTSPGISRVRRRRGIYDMAMREPEANARLVQNRKDGWKEIELGEFFNDEGDDDYVKMRLMEIKDQHRKGGLIVEGIEVRPKVEVIS
ncbi:hypothetical protein RJ640_022717 [Escallonia rubra]|uniref:Uncharacterized protein n=1 Tax=Escallonia rubra TaxID=112253 RepID=A0AA88U7D2_9ASTE|nr:hypothetical protein RJ640_022717 [Escallonia rubra]